MLLIILIACAFALAIGKEALASEQRAAGPTQRAAAVTSSSRSSEGRVVAVRRGSREIAVRTAAGEIERVVVSTKTAVRAPHGGSGLSAIRAGMVVRAEGEADRQGRLVARTLSAR